MKYRPVSEPVRFAVISAMVHDALTIREVAKRYGYSAQEVWRWTREYRHFIQVLGQQLRAQQPDPRHAGVAVYPHCACTVSPLQSAPAMGLPRSFRGQGYLVEMAPEPCVLVALPAPKSAPAKPPVSGMVVLRNIRDSEFVRDRWLAQGRKSRVEVSHA